MIEDDKWELRLKELHEPEAPVAGVSSHAAHNNRRERRQGVLTMIWSYKEQHKPFSFASMQALCGMMAESERYSKYMVARRSEWSWWDTWLDTFVRRVTYLHNQDNAALRREKTAWYEETYIALLLKYDIECERNPAVSVHNHYAHDSYGTGALTGYDHHDDHFGAYGNGIGGAGNAYDHDGYVASHHVGDAGVAGDVDAHQNSVDGDDDLYERDAAADPEVVEHEGGIDMDPVAVAVAGGVADDDMVMQNDEAEDEDVDVDVNDAHAQNDLAPV